MRRRTFCAACAAATGGLAGCTALDLPATGSHPFADSTLGVRVENRGETAHDIEANAREALEYWRAEHSQYLEFGVDFEIVDDSPDIILAYVETPESCSDVENYSEGVLGCAPWIQPGHRVSRPVTAYVVAADRPYGSIRTTAKHEIGHILGLGHDDEPREIMSNRPEDRIRLFSVRIDIWEAALAAHEQHNTATRRLSEGISAWNDESYDDAVDAFEAAETAFQNALAESRTASTLVDELDTDPPLETVELETLRDDLDRRAERLAVGTEIATIMGDASRSAADGESTRRQTGDANDLLAEFRSIGWAEIRTVAVALGLVRGFDRETDGESVDEDGL